MVKNKKYGVDIPAETLASGSQEITFKERDELMAFNTVRFWHCYYNPKTDVLYNQFCTRIMDNAYEYLLSIGAIDNNRNKIRGFEPEPNTDK